jgi:hypothetical protein
MGCPRGYQKHSVYVTATATLKYSTFLSIQSTYIWCNSKGEQELFPCIENSFWVGRSSAFDVR